MERLDKIIASQGKYSRSEVKKLVKAYYELELENYIKYGDPSVHDDLKSICIIL